MTIRSRLIMPIGGLVVGLLLAETVVAIVRPQPVWRDLRARTPAMHTPDSIIGHTIRPGFTGSFVRPEFSTRVSINAAGFRGPELRSGGDLRVVVLGDSFTFGHGVDDHEAYPFLLDSLLVGLEVVNGGFTAGSSPDMYYAWLRSQPLVLGFQVVLIGFFVGNDVDGHPEMAWQSVDSRGLPTRIVNTESEVVDGYLQSRVVPIGYRYPLLRESHLFHLLGSAYREMARSLSPPARSPSVFDATWTEDTSLQVRRTMDVFDGLARLCAERGLEFAVALIPTLQQVNGEADRRMQILFRDFFVERDIPVIDLFAALDGRPEAYYPEDQHWNALGHRLAAGALAAWYPTSGLPTRR